MAANAEAVLDAALKSIQSGKAGEARRALEDWLKSNSGTASHYLALAVSCRMTGDDQAGATVLDKVLDMEPRNLNALVMKGDLLAARQDLPAAAGFYSYVIKLAEQTTGANPEMQRMPGSRSTR
jgi:tetratricopeptide (TPR) repeat protein